MCQYKQTPGAGIIADLFRRNLYARGLFRFSNLTQRICSGNPASIESSVLSIGYGSVVRISLKLIASYVQLATSCLQTRINHHISDTRLNWTPAQQIRKTWRCDLSMTTYLSPYEACTPAMTIEVPLVLV